MPSKQSSKAVAEIPGVYVQREIHAYNNGGKDPITGEEFSKRTDVFESWDVNDKNHPLTKLYRTSPKSSVCLVEVRVDPSQVYTKQRTVLTNYNVPVSWATQWIELGHDAPEFDTSGMENQLKAEINSKQVVINQTENPETTQLLKDALEQNKVLMERIERLEEDNTSSKGGKK